MKNLFIIPKVLLLFAAFLVFSCEKENDTAPVISTEESQKIESTEALSYIKDLGFDEEFIEDKGEYYVVDGDMLFYKKMHVHSKNGKNTQYSSGQLVAPDRQQNISIRVDPSLSNWQTAVQNAINSFNSLADCRLRFNITTSSNADINIVPSSATAVADAVFPANGIEGFRIRINTAYTGANTDARRQLIIAHELGHCVGLRHSDWYNRADGRVEPMNTNDPNTGAPITAELIPGTPQSDANSVMNCCIAGSSWNGFSTFDIVAMTTLYPNSADESRVKLGDFNGDGTADVLYTSGSVWQISYGGTSSWSNVLNSVTLAKDLLVGDFNGDGKSDVLHPTGSFWNISYGANSSWTRTINSATLAKDLLIGDFSGDGRDDVLHAGGSFWNISYSANSAWTRTINSGTTPNTLLVGDYNGDSKDDVLYAGGSVWQVSYNATSSWTNVLNSAALAKDLLVGDFNGDGKSDVLHPTGSFWNISYGANSSWTRTVNSVTTANDLKIGDFNSGGRDDVFWADGTQWRVSHNATSSWNFLLSSAAR